jgi:hypothetical protein
MSIPRDPRRPPSFTGVIKITAGGRRRRFIHCAHMDATAGPSRTLAQVGSGVIAYGRTPKSFGPSPDAVVFHCQVERGYFLSKSFVGRLSSGLERCAVRGDGIVDVHLDFALDDADGLVLHVAFHAIFDVGEEGYEETLSGQLPSIVAQATGAGRITSAAPAHRWLNKTQFFLVGERDFQRLSLAYDLFCLAEHMLAE